MAETTTIIVSGEPNRSTTTVDLAYMETGSPSANTPVTPKRKPCKPQGPEYEYFDILSARENGKGWRIRCKFCGSREMNSHAPRMRKHLVLKCEGNVPEEVKNKFRNHRPVYTKSEDGQRKSGRKRTLIEFDGASSEEDDDNILGDVQMTKSEKARAAELISGLLMSQTKNRSEETTFCKKPLKQMTNEDFEREQKELVTKKMRMEIKILEDQSRFWSRMSNGVDKVLKAVDLYIESKNRAMDDSLSQVHTLYTNHDGSAVISTAYADQITGSVANNQ